MRKIAVLLVFMCALSMLLHGCSSDSGTSAGSEAGQSAAEQAFKSTQTYNIEQGQSFGVVGSAISGCDEYVWTAQGDYPSEYGVNEVRNGNTVTLLLPRRDDDYTMIYDLSCPGHDGGYTSLPARYTVRAYRSYLPLIENTSWDYKPVKEVGGFANSVLSKVIRTQGQEFLTYSGNDQLTSVRSYSNNSLGSDLSLRLSGVDYQYYKSGSNYDVKVSFNPNITLLADLSNVTEGSSETASIVTLSASPDIPNVEEYSKTMNLIVKNEAKDVTIDGKTYSGFLQTVRDADGNEILPARVIVKGVGVVVQDMPKIFVDAMGLDETPQYVLTKGPY